MQRQKCPHILEFHKNPEPEGIKYIQRNCKVEQKQNKQISKQTKPNQQPNKQTSRQSTQS